MTSLQPITPFPIYHHTKSSFKKKLIEMISFEYMNLVAKSDIFSLMPFNVINYKIRSKCHDCSDFSANLALSLAAIFYADSAEAISTTVVQIRILIRTYPYPHISLSARILIGTTTDDLCSLIKLCFAFIMVNFSTSCVLLLFMLKIIYF